MKKRKWTSQEKLRIVLEGLSGQIEITKLCAKYQTAQTQYYQWRDHLLKHGHQAFYPGRILYIHLYHIQYCWLPCLIPLGPLHRHIFRGSFTFTFVAVDGLLSLGSA